MLDKAFLRAFFDQIDSSSDEAMQTKIDQVVTASKGFPKGSEAAQDARFLLRHLRREMLERQFNPPATR